MSSKRERKTLILGVVLATGSSLTAVAVGHPDGMERAPMEALLGSPAATVDSAWDLPVTRNERVDKWIRYLSDGNADKTRLWLERSGRYEPMIREQLRARGMPEDLVYLAFIESGFSPRAYSHAAASGMWQFIEETGKSYGLEVNAYVDERRDPLDATRAALDYLQELYDHFGSWYLAAAAYNSGENRIDRILREHAGGRKGSDDLFWRVAPYLPQETRNYVPLMLAAGHISKSPSEYGFNNIAYHAPIAFDTAWVSRQTSLELVAQAAGVESEAVRELNPHLLRGVTPPGRAYPVRIPRQTHSKFARNFSPLLRHEVQAEKARLALAKVERRRHTVRRGETLGRIAQRYDVSVASLVRANNGITTRRLKTGKVLAIPAKPVVASNSSKKSAEAKTASKPTTTAAKTSPRSTSTASKSKAKAKVITVASRSRTSTRRYYRVRYGDTLADIADRYDTSVRRIQNLNDLGRRTRIQPGQKLRVK